MILQKIQHKSKTIYKKDNEIISVNDYYNILDGWDFMGYSVKSYSMKRTKNGADVLVSYVDRNITK